MQIPPSEFHKPSIRAIEDFINAKYADKVVHKIGLCVGFHSLISASEGLIGHGTGIVNVNVDFRLVVFRPFKGEILKGTITQSNHQGIYLSMDFFEDIVVPPSLLFENTVWDADDKGIESFIWRAKNDGGDVNDFYFDRAETCLFRVEQEEWNDLSPQTKRPQDFDQAKLDGYNMRSPPYRIIGSMQLSGLGPTLWWLEEEAAPEHPADAAMQGDEEGAAQVSN